MSARVDKSWNSKGIEAYPLEAILGTLAHYGVSTDEVAYRALSEAEFPLSIAARWHETWTGTGQFTRFPAAASEELWRRLCAPRVAPTDVALVLVTLLISLDEALEGKGDDLGRDANFSAVEAYLSRLPAERVLRDKFVSELLAALGEWMDAFDALTDKLVEHKLDALAERFVKLEEAIFPLRAGVASALLRAGRGEKPQALVELVAIADDAGRDDFARLAAVDGLLELGDLQTSQRVLLALVDKAEQGKDVELASAVVELITELLHLAPASKDQDAIRARVEALAASFGSQAVE